MNSNIKKHEQYFNQAAEEAKKAQCTRAYCGAVIVQNDVVIGRGYNAPPLDNVEYAKCNCKYDKTQKKAKSDRTCCMHAEWRAILDAVASCKDITGSTLYFTRVDDVGNILFSGEPYCTVCSRLALDVGIASFGLWHESGIRMYEAGEYNELSYNFHNKIS